MMNYFKNICLFALLILTFIQCTEIYNPDITSSTEALVVEGLITNDSGPYTVKLSIAKVLNFDSVDATTYTEKGATVTITDNQNRTYKLTESTAGTYVTSKTFKAEIGNTYKLHIKTKKGNTFESNSEKLLPPQTYDSIRGLSTYEDYVNSDNTVESIAGADIRMDFFNSYSSSDSVPACRFYPFIALQYRYSSWDKNELTDEVIGYYHWVNFGWATYKLNSIENITSEKIPSSSPTIKNHSICFVPFFAYNYALYLGTSSVSYVYYLKVHQYTMNHDSYLFYSSAINQLSASGKIFDPINSQLYTNMKCTNNSSKIVVGLFEVSSVKKHAFVITLKDSRKTVIVNSAEYLDISETGFYRYKVWDDPQSSPPKNDPDYIVIPLPDWWYHQ
jgi:hypothetical protein